MATGLGVSIRLDPDGAVFHRRFTRWADDLQDLTPAWDTMLTEFYDWEQEAFQTEGASTGSPWKKLTPAYAARKAITHPGRGILVRSTRLRFSLTRPFAGSDSIRVVNPLRMEVGTDVPYARYHQAVRPLIRLTDTHRHRWTQIMHRYMATLAGRYTGDL